MVDSLALYKEQRELRESSKHQVGNLHHFSFLLVASGGYQGDMVACDTEA